MLGSIRDERLWWWREAWIIAGKKKEDPKQDKESQEKDERDEQKDLGCRDHKQGVRFGGRDPGSSASVVLMAAESLFDEACYVQQ